MENVDVLGVKIANLTATELNAEILQIVQQGNKELVLNVNIHCMNLAYQLQWLRNLLNGSKIVFCDGEGVRLGAKILGKNIKEKITYNRWIWNFAEFSEKHHLSWYLIGSGGSVIEAAVKKLAEKYPALKVVGYRDGFFKDEDDVCATIADINEKRPNVVLLGMGMPLQEKWLENNWSMINSNIALTGGAVFEYVSGNARMTPSIMYKLKLEWFYRFIQEPKRLFVRYFWGNPLFFLRILRYRIKSAR